MKAKRGIIIVSAAVAVLAVCLGVLSYVSYAKGLREFIADGFILKPSQEVNISSDVNEQYYFSQGSKYKEKYGTKVLFKDTAGDDVSLSSEQFVHYADGSLGSFTKGVIMDVTDLDAEQYGYYNLTKNTILIKNGSTYEMSSRGEAMSIDEYIWKISDTDYMLVSSEITLTLGNSDEITLPDYAQIKYVDNGIVRIIHQQGTYQTISADSFLTTAGGAELNLTGKSFYVQGKPAIHLDKISLQDDSYIELDENADSNTPQFKIPTFNVVNGKNGASGANGTSGTDGSSGEDGADGGEGGGGGSGGDGGEGAEGMGGNSGGSGGRGTDGSDGLEGDSGIMGYDGKNGADGTDGESGKREDEMSGVVAAEIFTRPTVNMETEGYKVTPNGVEMHLNLTDLDNSLVQGKTTVTIYDRETMKPVASLPSWGEDLYNSGSVVVNTSNLAPDREYILIVAGEYYAEGDDTEGREANLFTKIFRTNSLGVTLEKGNVTDSSVLVRTRKVGSDVNTFGVELYYYDDNHNKIPMGTYTGLTSGGDLIFELDKPINTPEVKSNTLYYAALCNIELSGVSSAVSTEGTEIELRTLKKKPYKKEGGGAIASLQPVLSVNNKSHTATLSLQDEIADIDNGITGFRYELYRATEVLDAKTKNDLSGLIPAYVVEVPNAKDQVFQLDPNDKDANNIPTEYIGRVVVLFNDNEKDNEYNTDFSKSARLEDSTFPLIEFVNVQKINGSYHDSINGYVKVTDLSGLLTPYLQESVPMILTITSEFEDVYTLKLFTPENPTSNLYYFEQDGLRKSTAYSLSVSGPVDTDGSGSVSAAEQLTYLAGTRVTTPTTKAFKLVASKEPDSTVAFSWRVNLAAGEDGALSSEDKNFYEHEAKTMEELELRLYRRTIIGGEEKEEQVGNALVVKDMWTKEYLDLMPSDPDRKEWKFKSEFQGAYLEDNEVKAGNITFENVADPTAAQGIIKGYTTDNPKTAMDSKMIVTPLSFARAENDSIFSSGDTFIIRAITTGDYTSHGTSNNIGFTDAGCQFEFKMEKTHIQASNPNTQVQVSGLIKNSEAKDHDDGSGNTITKDLNLDDNTVVGMRFQAAYPYSDALTVTYRIYELGNTVASPDASATSQNVYFKMDTSTVTEDWSTAYSDADCTAGNEIAKLVETIAVTDLQGRTSAGEAPEITLYFSDPLNPGRSGNVGNIAATLETGQSLKRGARYFIAYTVMTAQEGGYTCGGGGTGDHAYPNCAYKIKDPLNPEHVPFYRSEVVEVSKQKPRVQRYPWTSTSSVVEWKYRIIDPDATILKEDDDTHFKFYLTTAPTTAALATASETKLPENVDDYIVKKADDTIGTTGAAFNVKSFTVTDNNYYKVTLKYKALDYVNEVPVEIPSIPIYKQAAPTNMVATTSTDVNGVKLQGRLATADVTPPANIVGGSSGTIEKAIINQGGYRYRITLQGNNIDKIAALRVTFTEVANINGLTTPAPSVVYDPVYLNIGTATGTEQKWAYAYVDASALKTMKTNGTTSVKVTVEAYYSDGTSGLMDYNTALHNDYTVNKSTSFAGDQVYAMRWLKPDGTYAYRTMRIDPNDSTKTKVNFLEADTDTANGSVFLPFDNAGNKFEEGAAAEKASMGIRRPEQAMSLSDALHLDRFASTQMAFTYDENGIRSEIGDYITLEKLTGPVKLNLVTAGDPDTVSLLDLFPAIQEQKTETGSTGLYVQFKAIGSGAADDVRLYARIAELQKPETTPAVYKWLKLVRKNETIPGQQYDEYYEPDETSGRYDDKDPLKDVDSYYAKGQAFHSGTGSEDGESGIKLKKDASGNYYYPLRIKGLRSDTKYNIVIYAYDSTGEIVDLFSLDGQTTGYVYNKKTANLTKITLNRNVAYTYTDYINKLGTAAFSMSDGETGTDIWIYYILEDLTNGGDPLINMALVPPSTAMSGGGQTLNYYSQVENAHSIQMNMHPAGSSTSANPLVLGNKYRLTIVIKDTLGNPDGKTPENAGALSDNSSDYVLEFTPTGYNNTNKLAPAYLGLTLKKETDSSSKPQIKAEVVITDSQRSVKDFTIELYDENGIKVATQAIPVEDETTPIVQTVTFSSTGAYTIEEGKDYTVKVIANRDANNDGTVEDASKVEKEKTISINDKLDANVSWSINANTKLLTLKLSDLNGFSNVNKIMYTIYYKPSASGSATPIGTGEQTLTAGQSGYTLTYNGWEAGYPKDGYYTFELQFYNGTTRLGNKDVSDQEWKASTGLSLFRRNADDADDADAAKDDEAVTADSAEDADADVSEAETPAETAAPAETVTGSETVPTQTEDTAPAAEEAAAGEIDAAVTEP